MSRPLPEVHFYKLSRLVHAQVAKWQQLIKEIEAGKTGAFSYYLPAREGIVQFCAKNGRDRDRIVSDIATRAAKMRGPAAAKANVGVFETFENVFFPRIEKYRRNFLRAELTGVEFEGVSLTGAAHLQVIDKKGQERFVILHCSEWPEDDLKAYLELLAVLLEKQQGAPPKSIWCMDLKHGRDVKWQPSKRILSRCKEAARLYSRFLAAMASPN